VKEELLSELLAKHGFRRELTWYQQIANAVQSNRGEDQLRCNAFWNHCLANVAARTGGRATCSCAKNGSGVAWFLPPSHARYSWETQLV